MPNPIGPEQQVGAQSNGPHKQRAAQKMDNRLFSREITAAMFLSPNKGTAAMLVSPTNPLGIELSSYAGVFFCFNWSTRALIA